jgi:hypothetical protein
MRDGRVIGWKTSSRTSQGHTNEAIVKGTCDVARLIIGGIHLRTCSERRQPTKIAQATPFRRGAIHPRSLPEQIHSAGNDPKSPVVRRFGNSQGMIGVVVNRLLSSQLLDERCSTSTTEAPTPQIPISAIGS